MRYALTPFAQRFLNDDFFNWSEFGLTNANPDKELRFTPAADVYETDKEYVLNFDLPGIKESDVSISLDANTLRVSGERKVETEVKTQNRYRSERSYGKFERAFALPEKVLADKIEANFKDGVLSIHIPKAEEVKPRTIQIKTH